MIDGICIPPDEVAKTWARVSDLVRRAAEPGDTPFEEFESDVLAGKGLLWLATENETELLAAVVTHLEIIKGVKVCTISALAGHGLDKILPLIEKLENYGRAEGCARMRVNGRKAWQRVLGTYDLKQIVLEKDLKNVG